MFFLRLAQHVLGMKLLQTTSLNKSLQSLLHNNSQSCLVKVSAAVIKYPQALKNIRKRNEISARVIKKSVGLPKKH